MDFTMEFGDSIIDHFVIYPGKGGFGTMSHYKGKTILSYSGDLDLPRGFSFIGHVDQKVGEVEDFLNEDDGVFQSFEALEEALKDAE